MDIKVLGCSGAEFPGCNPPAFLVGDRILLDAGTVGSVLSDGEQAGIRDIFITHAHLDHIRGIPALADNVIISNHMHTVTVHGPAEVITSLQTHIFNNAIWPDFSVIPDETTPVIRYGILECCREYQVQGYSVTPIPVEHTVPAVGYLVRENDVRLLYTGDTGPTDLIWKYASGVDALIVEVSFPNAMESLALHTGHLTCSLLEKELARIDVLPGRILLTHPKPQYVDVIRSEVRSLGLKQTALLQDGERFSI